MRSALDHARWTVRWWLKQRRPRPDWGDSTIDYLISGTQTLVLIAAIIAIGG